MINQKGKAAMLIQCKRTACVIISFFLLAACDKAPVDEATVKAPPPASEQAPAAGNAELRLALDGAGLRVFNSSSGSARAIEFGTRKTEFLDLLEKVVGQAAVKQGNNEDCGATNATWSNGLVTWFQNDQFVGWSISQDQPSPLRTANGIGLEMTRAELENSGTVVQVAESTIGTEFSAGNVAGLLSSSNTDGVVSNMWAGQVCIAR